MVVVCFVLLFCCCFFPISSNQPKLIDELSQLFCPVTTLKTSRPVRKSILLFMHVGVLCKT